jgi:DNA-binding CsgD family transcriptional regulator
VETRRSDRARKSPGRRDWQAEYTELLARDRADGLGAADLDRLARAAYLIGREADSIDILTRAHNIALASGDTRQAARSAVGLVFVLVGTRELTRAAGWAARARRVLEDAGHDCVECGYVMLPSALEQVGAGDLAGAEAMFAAIEQIGDRFNDRDLISLARQGRGRVLVATGRVAEGVRLFDEAMVAVTTGEVSPLIAGVVYCSVISACFDLLDIRRARDWTAALSGWCEDNPGLVPYRGECHAHQAEILRLRGRWAEALDEARRACNALVASKRTGYGTAAYALAELYRMRGDVPAADRAYHQAGEHGRTPYPGLALLRLAQGQREVARAAIDRVMAEPARGRRRAEVLVAGVEILLSAGDVPAARRAAGELATIADTLNSEWLRAMAASAAGAVDLAEGEVRQALAPLRQALSAWEDLEVPYEAARVKVLLGRACHALGDADGARLEWDSAARVFRQFNASPALAEVEALQGGGSTVGHGEAGGLTAREIEVLRQIALGKTNRAIAEALEISEKTVARHVSNIFIKLDLASRAAATAYAFTHGLMA